MEDWLKFQITYSINIVKTPKYQFIELIAKMHKSFFLYPTIHLLPFHTFKCIIDQTFDYQSRKI
mgnify:CR=1 FL=1